MSAIVNLWKTLSKLYIISPKKRELIDRLLLERISLAGIARVAKVSQRWLQTYVNQKYALVPRLVKVAPKTWVG